MSTKGEEARPSAFDNFPKDKILPVKEGDMLIGLNHIPFPRDSKWFTPSLGEGKKDYADTSEKPSRPGHVTIVQSEAGDAQILLM